MVKGESHTGGCCFFIVVFTGDGEMIDGHVFLR
jgi:hypothetical protein